MGRVEEIRIAAMEGIQVPDGVVEGTTLTVTARVMVSKVDQDWVDVTTMVGKPELLPGAVTICTVAYECEVV